MLLPAVLGSGRSPIHNRRETEAYVLARIPKLAERRRQRVADDGGDFRGADEPPGSGCLVRRGDAEALVGEQHDAHVRGVLTGAGRLVSVGVQDGLRHARSACGHGFFGTMWGKSGTVLSTGAEEGQAIIPSITEGPPFHFPEASLVYFQFVFAAITPILMLGSVLGRVSFKAWIPFVLLWITFVYTVNAFLIWGGGYFAAHGRAGLLRWLCHPSRGRHLGLRRGGGDRATIATRSRDRRAEQPADGRGRSRSAVAGLERLQRWGLLLRGRERLGGGAQHEPLYRGGDARVDRVGLHLPRQAVADRLGQRDDHRAWWRSPRAPVSSTAGAR